MFIEYLEVIGFLGLMKMDKIHFWQLSKMQIIEFDSVIF